MEVSPMSSDFDPKSLADWFSQNALFTVDTPADRRTLFAFARLSGIVELRRRVVRAAPGHAAAVTEYLISFGRRGRWLLGANPSLVTGWCIN